MTCPEFNTLDRWRDDTALVQHVGECSACAAIIEMIEQRAEIGAVKDCARFEPLVAAYLDDTLSTVDARELEGHLAYCLDCAATIGTLAPDDGGARGSHEGLPIAPRERYALGKEIFRGGMGRILEAEDLRIGRPVVIKELLTRTPVLAARFEREARLTARLQHPGIIPIYEIGRWPDGTPFYSMRKVAGRTLRDALRGADGLAGRLALLPSVLATADAVAYAHSRRFIHRDLKPANILVGDFGETVVIDWGLAKDLSDTTGSELNDRLESLLRADKGLTTAGSVIGTPAYMPPEQAAGKPVDERADVYALGAILYDLVAGAPPYDAKRDVLAQVKAASPAPIERVAPAAPRELVRIITRAMARDATERYANAAELAADLRAAQTTAIRSRRWWRRSRQ
jgi:serine/threonine protein kinase